MNVQDQTEQATTDNRFKKAIANLQDEISKAVEIKDEDLTNIAFAAKEILIHNIIFTPLL